MAANEYSLEWFKDRALRSLKRIDDTTWDYSDSLLLYSPDGDVGYEQVQATDTLYYKLITAPEHAFLRGIAHDVVAALPDNFLFVDLGPGTEHKEQFIFDQVHAQHKTIHYAPVDISDRYLRIASEYAVAQGIDVTPLRAPFEDALQHMPNKEIQRFVSLGMTYGNYVPKDMLYTMRRLMGSYGYGFISAHIRDRVSMPEVVRAYEEGIYGLLDSKIALLGVDPKTDVSERRVDDAIQGWYTLGHVPEALAPVGVAVGDTMLMFRTLRPTAESYRKSILDEFPNSVFFDTGGPFIGTLLRT